MQPHGQFDMERRGQMLICRSSGPFNLAGAMAYEAGFRRELAGLMDRPWGIVEVATEFEAAGPEVLARVHSSLINHLSRSSTQSGSPISNSRQISGRTS